MSQINIKTAIESKLKSRVLIRMNITIEFQSSEDEARLNTAADKGLLVSPMKRYEQGIEEITTQLEKDFEELINYENQNSGSNNPHRSGLDI